MSYSLAVPLPLWNRSASRNSPLASSCGAPGIGSTISLSGIAATNPSTCLRMRSRTPSGISSISSEEGRASMMVRSMASISAADISFISAALGTWTGNASLTIRLMNSGETRYQPTTTTTTAPARDRSIEQYALVHVPDCTVFRGCRATSRATGPHLAGSCRVRPTRSRREGKGERKAGRRRRYSGAIGCAGRSARGCPHQAGTPGAPPDRNGTAMPHSSPAPPRIGALLYCGR